MQVEIIDKYFFQEHNYKLVCGIYVKKLSQCRVLLSFLIFLMFVAFLSLALMNIKQPITTNNVNLPVLVLLNFVVFIIMGALVRKRTQILKKNTDIKIDKRYFENLNVNSIFESNVESEALNFMRIFLFLQNAIYIYIIMLVYLILSTFAAFILNSLDVLSFSLIVLILFILCSLPKSSGVFRYQKLNFP